MTQPLNIEVVKKDHIGIEVVLATSSTFKYAVVTSVNPASECYKQNVEMGDVILSIDNQPVFNYNHLENIANLPSGQVVKLSILKQNAFMELGLMSRCLQEVYGIKQKEMEEHIREIKKQNDDLVINKRAVEPEMKPNITFMQKNVSESVLNFVAQNNLDHPKTNVSAIVANKQAGSSPLHPKIIHHESKPSFLSNFNKQITINLKHLPAKDKSSPVESGTKFNPYVLSPTQPQIIKREGKPQRVDPSNKVTCHRHYQTLENTVDNRPKDITRNRLVNTAQRPKRPAPIAGYSGTNPVNQPIYKAKSLNKLDDPSSPTSLISESSSVSSISDITIPNQESISLDRSEIPRRPMRKPNPPEIPPRIKPRKLSNQASIEPALRNQRGLRKADKRKSRSVEKIMNEHQFPSMF